MAHLREGLNWLRVVAGVDVGVGVVGHAFVVVAGGHIVVVAAVFFFGLFFDFFDVDFFLLGESFYSSTLKEKLSESS